MDAADSRPCLAITFGYPVTDKVMLKGLTGQVERAQSKVYSPGDQSKEKDSAENLTARDVRISLI